MKHACSASCMKLLSQNTGVTTEAAVWRPPHVSHWNERNGRKEGWTAPTPRRTREGFRNLSNLEVTLAVASALPHRRGMSSRGDRQSAARDTCLCLDSEPAPSGEYRIHLDERVYLVPSVKSLEVSRVLSQNKTTSFEKLTLRWKSLLGDMRSVMLSGK